MKKNAFTIICALLTLALSMLFGTLFGPPPGAQASGAESHRAVASNHD